MSIQIVPFAVSVVAVLFTAPGPAVAQSPAEMEPGTWMEVPDTHVRDVIADETEFPGIRGTSGPDAIVGAWNGGSFDTRRGRLVITGGGHYDYYGNELYAFDVNTLSWSRITDPETPIPGEDIWNGTPQSRHTYDGLAYIEHLDEYWVFAGSGSTIGDSGFPPTTNVWVHDFGAGTWSYTPPGETSPPAGEGSSAVYDPVTRKVWYGEGRNSNPGDGWGLWSWDPDEREWSHHFNTTVFSSSSGCVDSERGLLFFLGRGRFQVVNIRGEEPTLEEWDAPEGVRAMRAPGIDYDPVEDRVVTWSGGAVYSLDPESREWTSIDAPGAPEPHSNGTFGRFAYASSVNAFVSVNDTDENVFFFKNGAGSGTGPVDAGPVDRPDTGIGSDAGGADVGRLDASAPDAGAGDSGAGAAPDSGTPRVMTGGCSALATAESAGFWALLLLLWGFRRHEQR